VTSSEPKRAEPSSRIAGGRAFARIVKLSVAAASLAGLGVLAVVARATHPGVIKHASTMPALTAPRSFVSALSTGLAPGAIGPATGPAQAVSGGS
jgi:hypothetical protein